MLPCRLVVDGCSESSRLCHTYWSHWLRLAWSSTARKIAMLLAASELVHGWRMLSYTKEKSDSNEIATEALTMIMLTVTWQMTKTTTDRQRRMDPISDGPWLMKGQRKERQWSMAHTMHANIHLLPQLNISRDFDVILCKWFDSNAFQNKDAMCSTNSQIVTTVL